MNAIIGVGGGSCSGKTTLIRHAQKVLGDSACGVLFQDNYYIDQSAKFDGDGGAVNYDHPDAIDFELLASHLEQLKKGHAVQLPQYDFATHKRKQLTVDFVPKPLILVDGILIFTQPHVLKHFDFSIFIECDQETRLARRVQRDVSQRGRTQLGVLRQFKNQVAPMHDQFVEPSKTHATLVIGQQVLSKIIGADSSAT